MTLRQSQFILFKCIMDDIQVELTRLEGKGFPCIERIVKNELKRRKVSAGNPGRKIVNDTEQKRKWREAKRKQRTGKPDTSRHWEPTE